MWYSNPDSSRWLSTSLRVKVFFLLAISFTAPSLFAQLYSLETKDLRLVYYGQAESYLVPHAARCFENSLAFHKKFWNYAPSQKITVFLHDLGDYGNAGASTAPNNRISVAIAPISYVYETAPANERMNAIMNHEIVHIIAGDKASRSDRFFRTLFRGKVSETSENPLSIFYSHLTTPRRSAPRWYHEGIAVFMETWMAGGLGRALGAYDEMVFRTLVRDSSHIYDLIGLESEGTKIDFQVGVNSYLYGTRFMSYLAYQYGPQLLVKWVSRGPDTKSYFASQFRKTYRLSLDDAWSQWIQWEQQFQAANLDSIRLYPTTPYRMLSRNPLGSVSRAYFDPATKTLYAAVNYPGQVAHLAGIRIEDGSSKPICEIKGATLFYAASLAFDASSGKLFFTTDNDEWRDLNVVEIASGRKRILLKDARIGDLAFSSSDKSIWGVRHFNGISTIVKIPYPYQEWNQVYSWPYGRDIYDIDISPDGTLLSAALAEIDGSQRLIKMETAKILAGDTTYEVLHNFENSNPAGFVFSPDGKYLYGSSYYTGVSNIFRYSIETDSMEVLSNCETGFFRPVPISDDSLIVFRFSGGGFSPVMIANKPIEDVSAIVYLGQQIVEKYPEVTGWLAGSPAAVNIDSLTTHSGGYSGLKNIRLVSAYPIVEGYQNYAAVGVHLSLSDPIALHNSALSVSYSPGGALPRSERVHASWRYSYSNWEADLAYNAADFYDLFGPTKTSRKGYSLGIKYQKKLLSDGPKQMDCNFGVTRYGDLQRLPEYQNVTTSYDRFIAVNSVLFFSNQRSSLGAVDFEKGLSCQIAANAKFVNRKIFPRFFTKFDWGLPLPINHSSIWFRSSAGFSPSNRIEPLARFYFGGFGNNWVDYQSERRYRAYYSFPGVELNAIGGINYGKLMAEWSLPPIRFRRLGTPSLFGTWLRLALFSTGIVTDFDSEQVRRSLLNVGSQLDFRLIMLSHLNMTMSVGYAAAFEKGEKASTELMFSLKVL